jgi:hypothetical protein
MKDEKFSFSPTTSLQLRAEHAWPKSTTPVEPGHQLAQLPDRCALLAISVMY